MDKKLDKQTNQKTKKLAVKDMPKKLNKLGEWFMSDNKDGLILVNDMKAVLR